MIQETKRKKEGLASLAKWTHINCMKSTEGIQDDMLRAVHLTRQTIIDVDLEDKDADQSITDPKEVAVKDVPGGTITFVFERVSKTDI